MTKKVCWKCGKRAEFQSKVEDVSRTICCEACCLHYTAPTPHLYAGSHRIPDKYARGTYECSEQELATLAHCVMHYPSATDRKPRFFLGAEVTCLAERRNKSKWKKTFQRKKAELHKALGLRLQDIHPSLGAFLFEDYLSRWGKAKATLQEIQNRFEALHRVQEIRKRCIMAHPMAVFDFCVSHPKAGAAQFEEMKEKVAKVFRLEGDRIMRHISKAEREALLETPLKDCAQAFARRDKTAVICAHLERSVSRAEAQEIVRLPACQLRIAREDDEARAAMSLLRFWRERNDVEKRRSLLQRAIESRTRDAIPSSTLPQKMYIYGIVDVDPEEIVGLLCIASKDNFGLLSKHRVERISIAVSKFEENLHKKNMDEDLAMVDAILYAQKVPLPDVDDVRDTFDYKQLATGYWSDRWYKL